MNISVEQLLQEIGSLYVQNQLLQAQIARLQALHADKGEEHQPVSDLSRERLERAFS